MHQIFGEMIEKSNGSTWKIDHCLQISSFNLLDENEIRKCFKRINLGPLHFSENRSKKAKDIHHLYLLQQIETQCFLKSNG